jgi:uncharacterized membrane protein (DUF4010 family)
MPEPGLSAIFGRLLVALALGLLIGLERGWERRDAPEGHRAAGFRTFGLISLLGAVSTLPITGLQQWLAPMMLAGLALIVAAGYWRSSEQGRDISMTSAVAALLTFVLGGMAGVGELTVAAASAVVVTILLGFKPELHRLLQKIAREELEATLRLLLISVVVLPILPNRGLGPWQALNPYRIWWMVVLVAAISYLGYFANRVIGLRGGVIATALVGGLASSTAVTVSLSREAKEQPASTNLFAAGITAASGIMFPRMVVIAAIVAPGLAIPLAIPLIAAALVSFAMAALVWWIHRDHAIDRDTPAQFRNPLNLRTAFEFGAFFTIIMFLSQAARQTVGARGLYLIGAFSGLVDVDAITLAVANLWSKGHIVPAVAVGTIVIAAAVNTIVKSVLAGFIGGPRLGIRVGGPLLIAMAAAAAVFWLRL